MTNAEKIRQAIIDTATLCEFSYKGKSGNIDPGYVAGEPDSFLLWFDGKEQIVHGFDEVMNAPFFDGMPLRSIAEQLTDIEW